MDDDVAVDHRLGPSYYQRETVSCSLKTTAAGESEEFRIASFELILTRRLSQDDLEILQRIGTTTIRPDTELLANGHQEFDANHEGIVAVRLATSCAETAEKEERQAVALDLDEPQSLSAALDGIDRVFLITGYTAVILYQSEHLVDAVAAARVEFIVHLGEHSLGQYRIPYFKIAWHDMVESYIKASGLAWTNLHPNVILDSFLVTEPSIMEKRSFDVLWGEAALGWISAADIGSVAAAVLREVPEKHAGADYGLSPEILTGPQAAAIITEATGVKIGCNVRSSEYLAAYVASISDAGTRLYLESAVQTMRLGENGRMEYQATVCNDFEEVMHRPATSLRDWALQNLVTKRLKTMEHYGGILKPPIRTLPAETDEHSSSSDS